MVNAQEWLDNNYPTRNENKIEGVQKSLEGELIISNFPNLEKVILSNNQITKLIFQNCPKVKEINIYNNQLTKLEIKNLFELEYLHCGNNQLNELDVSENTKLKTLFYLNNPLENQLEKLQGIENLTELEWFRGRGLIKKVKEEREIHQDAMKAMDNFYRQNPPSEDIRLTNILQAISNDYLAINYKNKQAIQQNINLNKVIEGLEKIVIQTKEEFLLDKIDNKCNQLEQLKTSSRSRLNESWYETLEDILEAQKIFIKSNNDLTLSQLRRFKQRLLSSGQINQDELQEICQVQAELSFLELKLEKEQEFQAQIEISGD